MHENFQNIIGKNAGDCLITYRKSIIQHASDLLAAERRTDKNRSMWKIPKDQMECDVESVRSKHEEHINIKDYVKKEKFARVFSQIYTPGTWKDIEYLRKLSKDSNFSLPQTPNSSAALNETVTKANEQINLCIVSNIKSAYF